MARSVLADESFESAVMQRLGGGELTLRIEQTGKIVDRGERVGMVGPERLLPDLERALKERPRAGEIALGLQQRVC